MSVLMPLLPGLDYCSHLLFSNRKFIIKITLSFKKIKGKGKEEKLPMIPIPQHNHF